ncbi:putative Lipoprotein [Streptococcus sp. DD11]|nr:putative Lipoprotein [Streptococcus sp. DD11]
MTVAAMNGWRLDDHTVPKNRTREQYDFEGTFNPIVNFLNQEKKDFTGIKSYYSYVGFASTPRELDEVYRINLDTEQSPIVGTYEIEKGGEKQKVPITYSNQQITYEEELTPQFDEDILNMVLKPEYFESLDIQQTRKSAETELSQLIYKPENQSDLFKKLKKKYEMPSDTKLSVILGYAHYNEYNFSITLKSKDKIVYISSSIYLNKGE